MSSEDRNPLIGDREGGFSHGYHFQAGSAMGENCPLGTENPRFRTREGDAPGGSQQSSFSPNQELVILGPLPKIRDLCPLGRTPTLVPELGIFILNISGIEPGFSNGTVLRTVA